MFRDESNPAANTHDLAGRLSRSTRRRQAKRLMVLCATRPGPAAPSTLPLHVRFTDDLLPPPGTVSATTKSMGSSDERPI